MRPTRFFRRLAGPFFVLAGALHFARPKLYLKIMPPYIPAPETMVYASGVAEIAGGTGLMLRAHRRLAGWWLIATLIAISPTHLHMALHPEDYPQIPGGAGTLWARLPFQGVFIAWVLSAMRR
ncbi:MAG: DoxX family protein [Solirubrobacteraceae bacterium]